MAKIKSMRIVFHGYEHAQYFQGHDVSFTKYTHCATGAGQSHSEALHDALECLYLPDGIEVTDDQVRAAVLEETGKTLESLEEMADQDHAAMHSDCPSEDDWCELYYYVSIDVEIGE